MAVAGLRHVGLKVLSIGLAMLLWLLVAGEQLVERALHIPLELTNVPPQLEIVDEPPTAVDVRVRGSSGALSRVSAGELVAVLDLGEARPGRRLFHMTPAQVRAPFGVDVVQVTPSNVSMRFEQSADKTVPVVPAVEGQPAHGFAIGTVSATPATVQLVGAASVLSTITEAVTEPVSVAGRTASFVETVVIGSPDPLVRLQSPQMAQVAVNVTPAPVEWSVADVQVQIRNATRPTSIAPGRVTVYVRGPQDARGIAEAFDFDAFVDVDGLGRGAFDLSVRVVPPTKVGVVRVEPERVRVTIR
jgi:YbbR domain-containing protein